MKLSAILVAVVLAAAGARAAEPGQTTLQPAAAQTQQGQGTTVLHANQAAPANGGPGPNFHPVKVQGASDCACVKAPCDCHAPEYVTPELKCEASPCSTHPDTHPASCGCLHMEVCPCKKEFQAPEIAAPHHAPEVVEQLPHKTCGTCESCSPCPSETHVQPEIKEEPKCGCQGCDSCAALHSNSVGTTVLHPTTTNAANPAQTQQQKA